MKLLKTYLVAILLVFSVTKSFSQDLTIHVNEHFLLGDNFPNTLADDSIIVISGTPNDYTIRFINDVDIKIDVVYDGFVNTVDPNSGGIGALYHYDLQIPYSNDTVLVLLKPTSQFINAPKNVKIKFTENLSLVTEPNTDFNIFPNPANNFLTVKGDVKRIQIVDMTGNIVIDKNLQAGNSEVEISTLKSGIYTAIINSEKQVKILISK